MNKIFPYAKAVVAALVPTVQLAYGYFSDQQLTGTEWRDIGLSALGALFVLLVPAKGYRAPGEGSRSRLYDQDRP